jgi:hypothetical protein
LILNHVDDYTVQPENYIAILKNSYQAVATNPSEKYFRISDTVILKIIQNLENPFSQRLDARTTKLIMANIDSLLERKEPNIEKLAIFERNLLLALIKNENSLLRLVEILKESDTPSTVKLLLLQTFSSINFVSKDGFYLAKSAFYPSPNIQISAKMLILMSKAVNEELSSPRNFPFLTMPKSDYSLEFNNFPSRAKIYFRILKAFSQSKLSSIPKTS